MSEARVVVTGIGAVSPLGIGREALWKCVTEGGVARGGGPRLEVGDFDAAAILRTRGLRYIGRGTRFVAAASRLALEDAGYDDPAEMGFALGTAFGNTTETFNFTHRTLSEGVGEVLPMASFDAALNSQANFSAVHLGARRFTRTVCGMTASLEALADAAAAIRSGRARAVVAAGIDYWSPELEEWLRFERPDLAVAVAEGAYALVLEEGRSASERGAQVLAEIGRSARRFDLRDREASSLAEALGRATLADERPDLVIHCGEPVEPPEGRAAAARRFCVRDLAGESLGARGCLGVALASLALHARTAPGGESLPPDTKSALVTDFEPGASWLCLAVRSPGAAGPV